MNGTKWKLLFFAPVSRIIRTDDRTKANTYERIRIAIVHAKFVFSQNTPYFAHLSHNGFGDALLARRYCAYNGMKFHARCNAYNGVIMTRHYCAYNGMGFMSRDTRYKAGDFGVSLLRVWWRGLYGALCRLSWRAFCVRHMRFKPGALLGHYCAYNAGSFSPPLLCIWQGHFPRHYFNNFSFH